MVGTSTLDTVREALGESKVLGRMLADVDPETGEVFLDPASGLPRLVPHYTVREAAPFIGVSREEVRRRCLNGEWPCRLGDRGAVYLSMADMAVAIESLRHRPRKAWDDEWQTGSPGIRGVVVDEDPEADR